MKKLGLISLVSILSFSLIVVYFPQPTAAIACGFGTDNGSGVCVGALTANPGAGNQTFSVPSDWNSLNNSVECIGSGGKGANGAAGQGGGGGGSGAYAGITNLTLTPGGTATYRIGASATTTAVTNAVAGARVTFFNGAASSSASLTCDWGKFANGRTGGAAGTAEASIGSTEFAGAAGATQGTSVGTGAGGAGSAGPIGAGKTGGIANIGDSGGGGGGGSNGGSSTAGSNGSGSNGGNGGQGTDGTGNGSGGTSVAACTNGTTGKGAGGGGATNTSTCAGSIDASFDATHGAGGGGGGGGTGVATGGAGGTYGGGGGGGASISGAGGNGGQGIIWIEYTPDGGSDSCTYSGSGDWNILGSDACQIGTTYVAGACNFIGSGHADLNGPLSCVKVNMGVGFRLNKNNSSGKLHLRS